MFLPIRRNNIYLRYQYYYEVIKMECTTNVIVAQHPDRIVYVTEAYDFNGKPVAGLCGSTHSLEKMLYHLKSISFPKEQRFISEVPKIDDPRAKVLRELTEEEKTYLGQFFGTTLTDRLLEYAFKHREPYDVNVRNLTITCFPDVFPPVSPFSYDAIPLAEMNDAKEGEFVLDIGTGTGVQAVISARNGARKVVATDISKQAIENCRHNAEKYGFEKLIRKRDGSLLFEARWYEKLRYNLERIIEARQGNLFEPVRLYEKLKGFDLIIANLPFVNHPVREECERWVYDEDYQAHKGFFSKVREYLKKEGRVLISFSNIGDVGFFEGQITKSGLSIRNRRTDTHIGKEWYVYKLTKK